MTMRRTTLSGWTSNLDDDEQTNYRLALYDDASSVMDSKQGTGIRHPLDAADLIAVLRLL